MKWFKHYTDNHRGRSIQDLMDQLGHTGLCYFLIVEMCAEKLNRKVDSELSEDDCIFTFHERILRQNLRVSPTNLRRLLDICRTNGLISFEFSGKSVQIKMPILLDLLDYDSKKSRKGRSVVAHEIAPRIEQNRIYNTSNDVFEVCDISELWNQNCKNLPKVQKLNETRKKKIKKLWLSNPSEEYWISLINKITESDFLSGRKTNWKANFDWFINETNQIKVLEGNYNNEQKRPATLFGMDPSL